MKKKTPDYKNWMPKGMILGLAAGCNRWRTDSIYNSLILEELFND